MIYKRRRGVCIVKTKKGILVVSGKDKKFILPGGGAKNGESRKRAAIRELWEETTLKTKKIKYLFSYVGSKFRSRKGKLVRNYTRVFLVIASGIPRPTNEIKYIEFWNPESKIYLKNGSKKAIEKYLKLKNNNN